MKDSPHPLDASSSLDRLLGDLRSFVHREPVQSMAMAVGAGFLLNLLPKRVVAGAVAGLGAVVLPPALIALGLAKALELCCQRQCGSETPLISKIPLPEDRAAGEEAAGSRPSQWSAAQEVSPTGRVSPHGGGATF